MSWFFSSKNNNNSSSSSSSQAPPNETEVLASAQATFSAGGLPLSLLLEVNDNEAWLTHVAQEDASYLSRLELKVTVSISEEVRSLMFV
jgi:hypothetical protein